MAAPKYRFKKLDIATLVPQLSELGINLTAADLENPQPVTAHYLYKCLVDIIMGASGAGEAPRFAALEQIEHPELHEESLVEARFNANLRKIMNVAGVPDFAFTRDVHQPTKQRLIVHLSALYNLVLYRMDKLSAFSDKAHAAEQLNEQRQRVELETQEAQARLRQLRQQQEKEEPILSQIASETETHKATITQFNTRQAALQTELRDLKAQANEKMDKIAQLKLNIGNNKQDGVKLQSMILQSPEKVKKSIDDMEHSLENMKLAINDCTKRSEELKARYLHCGKIEKDIRKCVTLLGEIEQETNKYKKNTKQSKDNKTKKLELQKHLEEILTQEQSVQRNISTHSDRMTKSSQNNVVRKEQTEQQLSDIKEEKKKLEKEQAALKPKLDQQALEILQVQQQITERWQEYERLEREELAHYRKLVDSVQKYLI